MYIALCSVKDTEGERNTGFLSYFTAHSLSILSLSLPPSFPLIFHCSLCVLVFIQMFGFEWQFLLRLCTSGLTRLICILHPWKKGNRKRQKASAGRQAVRAMPVVWFWQLNWPQCCRCVMFKGRFKVTLSTGLTASDILNIYTFL